MEALSSDGPWTHATPINGRRIQGYILDGEWRWFIQSRGPAWQGISLDVLVLAGNTIEQARSLASRLGPLPDAEDETEKIAAIRDGSEANVR